MQAVYTLCPAKAKSQERSHAERQNDSSKTQSTTNIPYRQETRNEKQEKRQMLNVKLNAWSPCSYVM
jgi:hypothetical protein